MARRKKRNRASRRRMKQMLHDFCKNLGHMTETPRALTVNFAKGDNTRKREPKPVH